MIRFKQYLREFAMQSTSDYVFDLPGGQGSGSSGLKIPISGPMFKRIWPDTIRTTVFHTTDLAGLESLKKLEGGKIVGFEAQSKNRGRAEASRLKKEDVPKKGTGVEVAKPAGKTSAYSLLKKRFKGVRAVSATVGVRG